MTSASTTWFLITAAGGGDGLLGISNEDFVWLSGPEWLATVDQRVVNSVDALFESLAFGPNADPEDWIDRFRATVDALGDGWEDIHVDPDRVDPVAVASILRPDLREILVYRYPARHLTLESAVEATSAQIARLLAENPKLWQDLLRLRPDQVRPLADAHSDERIRALLIARPPRLTPVEQRERACRRDLKPDVIKELLRSSDAEVRRLLADNRSLSRDALRTLAGDEDDRVAQAALRALPGEEVGELLARLRPRLALAAAAMPHVPAFTSSIITRAAAWSDLRLVLATREDCPIEYLAGLACDDDWNVRGLVLGDKRLPVQIALDAVRSSRRTADLATVARRDDASRVDMSGDLMDSLTTSSNPFEIAALLSLPGLPWDVAADRLDPKEPAAYTAAVLNRHDAPSDVVIAHLVDPDPTVRTAALQAALERGLEIAPELARAARNLPFVNRPLPPGVVGLEVPIDLARMLAAELESQACGEDGPTQGTPL